MNYCEPHDAHPDMSPYEHDASAPRVMTPDQFRQKLRREGRSFVQFCQEKNLPYRPAFAVLTGVSKATRGKSHEYAVALGLKEAA